MAHSYISGNGLGFDVRDSLCEAILKNLRDELIAENSNAEAIEIVTKWYDYWCHFPPGCKELTFECPTLESRDAVSKALERIIPNLDPDGGLLRVAKQIEAILKNGP